MVLEHREPRAQNLGDSLLGGGLTCTASDADNINSTLTQDEVSPVGKRFLGVIHDNTRDAVLSHVHRSLTENSGSSATAGLQDIVMAVPLLRNHGEEKLPRFHETRVVAEVLELPREQRPVQPTVCTCQNVVEVDHRTPPLVKRCMHCTMNQTCQAKARPTRQSEPLGE